MYNKKVVESKKINLKGILVGNGVVDFSNDSLNAKYDFLFTHHITSDENRIDFIKYCLYYRMKLINRIIITNFYIILK